MAVSDIDTVNCVSSAAAAKKKHLSNQTSNRRRGRLAGRLRKSIDAHKNGYSYSTHTFYTRTFF